MELNKTTTTKLSTFTKDNELAMEVFKALSARERSSARSDIDAIFRELEGSLKREIDYFKYVAVWQEMESSGLGTLVHGRKGNPNRFVWKANLKEVGRQVLGLPKDITPAFEASHKRPAKEVKTETNTVTLVLPATVSKEDILAFLGLGEQLVKKDAKTKK
jgi:hypothetical protein